MRTTSVWRKGAVAAMVVFGGAAWLLSQSTPMATLENPPEEADVVLLARFGLTDQAETRWDGSVEAAAGEVVKVIGYQMRVGDLVHPTSRWEMMSRKAFMFQRRPHDEGWLKDVPGPVLLPPSVFVYAKGGDAARLRFETAQGTFEVSARDLPQGASRKYLDGKVSVERVAVPVLLGRREKGRDWERLTDNDHPSVMVTKGNVVWTAWQGFNGKGDRVFAERVDAPRKLHTVNRRDGDVYKTAIAEDSEGKVWVVWSERVNDNWDLYARSFDGESWSGIERLTTAAQPDAQHVMARAADGTLHLAWQGYRDGVAAIFHKEYRVESGWSGERMVSGAKGYNCWEPSLALDSKGNPFIAWDQYSAAGYDVYLRGRVNGQWGAVTAVAATPLFEAHTSVAVDKDNRVWVAWHESGINWGKDWGYPYHIKAKATGLYNSRNIRMAVLEGGKLMRPAQTLEEALPDPGNNFYEYPQLMVDGSGSVRVFFRLRTPMQYNVYPRTPAHHALWEIYTSSYDGAKWSPMVLVPYSTGRNYMPASMALDQEGNVVSAWPTDRRGFRDFINALPDVFAGRFARDKAAGAMKLTAYQHPRVETAVVHPNDSEDVRRIRDYKYVVNGVTYRIYRGDMHRHTEISWDGYSDGSTQDTYRYAIDAASMDYLAITEHNFGVEDEYDWWRSQKYCDLYRVGSSFVPLFGYERSVTYPNGHRNIIFSYRGAPVLDVQHYEWVENANYQRQGAERLYGYLRKYKGIAMSHTSATDMGTDWRDYDPEVEPLVEIYQSDRNSYECADCWRAAPKDKPAEQYGGYRPAGFVSNAWAKGYRLGVQASSDHLGVHTSYAMILAPELSREALVGSIRKRLAYGATDNIIVDYRLIDGAQEYPMGADAAIGEPARLKIHVEGTAPVAEVHVVKDNKAVYVAKPGQKIVDLEYRDTSMPGKEASFYYVRVLQQDTQVAWGSPIWVSRK